MALAVVIVAAPLSVSAREANSKEAGNDFGIGAVAVFANLVYMPVKLVYGVLGGVTGGLAYVLTGGNRDVAEGVWIPSLGGDYVLTTEMMKGRDRVHFSGIRPEPGQDTYADAPGTGYESSGSTF